MAEGLVEDAIILVGGEGQRLRPYTDNLPKPMVPVRERPILEYQVRWLAHEGIRHVVLCCGYKHEIIEDHFKDGSEFGVSLGLRLITPLRMNLWVEEEHLKMACNLLEKM